MSKEKILSLPLIMAKCKLNIRWNSKISGIYAWVNEINGKMYIGRSVNLYKRVYDEMNGFRNKKEQNMKKLFRAVNKYGIEKFRVVRLLECQPEYLNKLERLLIDYYDTKKNGYNCTTGGDGTHGHKVSDDQIHRQKIALKKYWSEEKRVEHSNKMRCWANDKTRKEHLINVGQEWQNNPSLSNKQLKHSNASLTMERIRRQKMSLMNYYNTNGGAVRYKEIIVISPDNKLVRVTNVKSFCHENNLGRNGFYEFVKRNDKVNSFRGWKVVSKKV